MLPFWKYIRKYRGILVLTLVLATINQVFSLIDPLIFKVIIDNYASKALSLSREVFIRGVLLLLLASIGVAFVSRVAKNFQDYYVSVITQRVGANMYAESVEHTFSLPYSIFEDRRSGEVLNKLQRARTESQRLIENFVGMIFLSLIGILFVVGYAFYVNWVIGIVYLSLIPIVGIFTFMITKRIQAAQKNIVRESAELAGSTTETIRNVELVKSLGLENQEIQRLNVVNDKILNLELNKVKTIRKLSFMQGTLINAMRATLLLFMLWLIFNKGITLGQFFSLYIYSFFIFTPLSSLAMVALQYQEAKAAYEQIEEILKIEPEKKPKNPKEIKKIENIEYDNVYLKYETADSPSVSGINLKIKEGETIAFVGPSGSGKSTLIKLLVGLYKPTKGKIFINKIDSNQLDHEELRKKIGLVSQDTQLFAGTIRENLLFVNPKASDSDCIKVLKEAAVAHIIERGGNGLDTKIGEGGIKLSGGEKQRLAIARALLRNPQLLIFDEATSSLDSITEKGITETIKSIVKGGKVISVLVAHRLSTISHADKIYVLEKGKIVEEGTHSQLLRKKGLYYAMWRGQQGGEK